MDHNGTSQRHSTICLQNRPSLFPHPLLVLNIVKPVHVSTQIKSNWRVILRVPGIHGILNQSQHTNPTIRHACCRLFSFFLPWNWISFSFPSVYIYSTFYTTHHALVENFGGDESIGDCPESSHKMAPPFHLYFIHT